MSQTYFGILAYDGSDFYGFEKQINKRTVQGSLEETLSRLCSEKVTIHGAGRTDRGVSARGQTFTFVLSHKIPHVATFLHALNRVLPKDMVVRSLEERPEGFDARHSCCGKVYSYSFHLGERDVLNKLEFQLTYPKFNEDDCRACLSLFQGRHNFQNFTAKPEDKDGFIRDITRLDYLVFEEGHRKVMFEANGFMTYQVRLMMGTAFQVALGRMDIIEVKRLLVASKREVVHHKADPIGLVLEEVRYGK